METTDQAGTAIEADARVLEAAADVLKRRFGMLTAGDLISGLTGAAVSIRARGGIIKPVIPGTTGSNKPRLRRLNEPRNGTLERKLDEPWNDEPGHGYHEAGNH
jgi:hypothetical protein